MQLKLEVVILPVSDVDRSLAFYRDVVGFNVDVDYRPNPGFRVVQLTPPGSAASIQLVAAETPVGAREAYLVTADLEVTIRELGDRGLPLGAVEHKRDAENWQGASDPGYDPGRRDYSSMARFEDPDGHVWVVQERGYRG